MGQAQASAARITIKCSKCQSDAFEGSLRDMFGTELVRSIWSTKGVKFSAFVCSGCGYIELFADNVKQVRNYLG